MVVGPRRRSRALLSLQITRSSGECRLEDAQVVAALIRRCVAGDAAAWEDIVRQYHRRIYNICYRFAGSTDEAEDV